MLNNNAEHKAEVLKYLKGRFLPILHHEQTFRGGQKGKKIAGKM